MTDIFCGPPDEPPGDFDGNVEECSPLHRSADEYLDRLECETVGQLGAWGAAPLEIAANICRAVRECSAAVTNRELDQAQLLAEIQKARVELKILRGGAPVGGIDYAALVFVAIGRLKQRIDDRKVERDALRGLKNRQVNLDRNLARWRDREARERRDGALLRRFAEIRPEFKSDAAAHRWLVANEFPDLKPETVKKKIELARK